MSSLRIKGKGPFLITCPHTIFLKRPNEIHVPEIHLKKILKKLEKKISEKYLTTITWNFKNSKKKIKYLDPNFYPKSKFKNSKWYLTLQNLYHQHHTLNQKTMLLVDLHGMKDDKQYDILVGTKALKKYKSPSEYKKINSNLREVLDKFCEKHELKIRYNYIFQGFINEKYYTITQQSNSIGIPGVQLELSKRLRDMLIKNEKILSNFSKTLLNFYKLNLK